MQFISDFTKQKKPDSDTSENLTFHCRPSTLHQSTAIRKLNAQHLGELYASFNSNLKNRMKLNFPPATTVAKTEDPFRPDAEVDLIDGNHWHHVMLQLQELYPEIEELKTR